MNKHFCKILPLQRYKPKQQSDYLFFFLSSLSSSSLLFCIPKISRDHTAVWKFVKRVLVPLDALTNFGRNKHTNKTNWWKGKRSENYSSRLSGNWNQIRILSELLLSVTRHNFRYNKSFLLIFFCQQLTNAITAENRKDNFFVSFFLLIFFFWCARYFSMSVFLYHLAVNFTFKPGNK